MKCKYINASHYLLGGKKNKTQEQYNWDFISDTAVRLNGEKMYFSDSAEKRPHKPKEACFCHIIKNKKGNTFYDKNYFLSHNYDFYSQNSVN